MLTMLYWSGMPLEWVVLLLAPLLTALFSLQLPWESLQHELTQALVPNSDAGIETLASVSHLSGLVGFLGYLWNGGLWAFLVDSFAGDRLPILVGILSWTAFTCFLAYRSLPWKLLAALGNAGLQFGTILAAPILWGVVLQDYQRDRLILFLDPSQDPLGGGYHLLQSMVGIGSGGLFGIGLLQGQLTKLRFIPEQHTDFIFSALGEETGFVGCSMVVVGFALLMGRLLQVARNARTDFEALVVIGIATMVMFQVVVNIFMTIGLGPVTGIPLPFLSYGRSAMVVNFIALGLCLSVVRQSRGISAGRR